MCNERLCRYRELINCMPVREQTTISRITTWQADYYDDIKDLKAVLEQFGSWRNDGSVEISRADLFDLAREGISKKLVYAVFIWGYPNGGQGGHFSRVIGHINQSTDAFRNTSRAMCTDKLNQLCTRLQKTGIGLSTWTKLLYFLQFTVEKHKALILDSKVIKAFQRRLFEDFDKDFDGLANINYDNAPALYSVYLQVMSRVAQDLSVDPDKLEMFLFLFGNSLKRH